MVCRHIFTVNLFNLHGIRSKSEHSIRKEKNNYFNYEKENKQTNIIIKQQKITYGQIENSMESLPKNKKKTKIPWKD
jgi:hypothetical protein